VSKKKAESKKQKAEIRNAQVHLQKVKSKKQKAEIKPPISAVFSISAFSFPNFSFFFAPLIRAKRISKCELTGRRKSRKQKAES
jgi:hypothetical protein